MKWTVKQIKENRGEPLVFDQQVDREASLMKRDSSILGISSINASGTLLYENHAVLASFQIDYTITLPSSRSLAPVSVSMQVPISEVYVEVGSAYDSSNESEVVLPIENEEVDLIPAIEDAILLNLPIQVLTKEEEESDSMPAGNDWVVLSEESYRSNKAREKEETVDPRFAKLQALLDDENME